MDIFPYSIISHLTCSAASALWPQHKRDVDLCAGCEKSRAGPWRWSASWSTLLWRQLGLLSLKKRRVQGDLRAAFQYLKEAYKNPFTWAGSDRARVNGFEMKEGRECNEAPEQVTREFVDVPSVQGRFGWGFGQAGLVEGGGYFHSVWNLGSKKFVCYPDRDGNFPSIHSKVTVLEEHLH